MIFDNNQLLEKSQVNQTQFANFVDDFLRNYPNPVDSVIQAEEIRNPSNVSGTSEGNLDEFWSFLLKDYYTDIQGGNVLDVTVSYDYVDGIGINDPFEYPDFTQIANFVDSYLRNYPNKNDFLEIVNKNLTNALLTQPIPTDFGVTYNLGEVVDDLTVNLGVQPGAVNIPHASAVSRTPEGNLDEFWSFNLTDYYTDIQGGNVLDVTVSYDYADGIGINDPFEYPDFTQIANFVDSYLTNYPNKNDFLEIVNKNLTNALLTQPIPTNFGVTYNLAEVVDNLTVDLAVQPGAISIPRASAVSRTPEGNLDEFWSFNLTDYYTDIQGGNVLDVTVSYDYADGIGINDPFEYPDFTQIANFVDDYLTNYPNKNDFLEIVNKNLTNALLTQPIPTDFGVTYNLGEVVDDLTVNLGVQPGAVNIPHASAVSRTPEGNLDEFWSFKFEDYYTDIQGGNVLDVTVSYDYADGIGINDPFEYPDFTQIANFVDDYLTNYPNKNDFLEIVNKNLTNALLTQPIPTDFGVTYNLAEVVDNLTVDLVVQPGAVNIPHASAVSRLNHLEELNASVAFDNRTNQVFF